MTLDNHLSDIFNHLNKDVDKVISKAINNNGRLTICPGGINNNKQCLKTVFGIRSQYFKNISEQDFAANSSFQEFFNNVKERGYCLQFEEIKQPISFPNQLLRKSLGCAAAGGLLWKIPVSIVKFTSSALLAAGVGMTALRLSNAGKAKVTFDIYKPDI